MLLIINDLLGDIAISDTKLNCLSFHFWYTIFLLYIEQFYQHVYILYPVILQRIRGMDNGSVFIGKDLWSEFCANIHQTNPAYCK